MVSALRVERGWKGATCPRIAVGQTAPSRLGGIERNGQSMLAQVTGFYRELPVGRPLQDHFACVWVHQLPVDAAPSIVVVPDGLIDLQWLGGGWRIAGPDRDPQTEALPAGATVVGFRFRPAAAAAWLGMPATEVLNQRVALEDLWGAKARRMTEEVEAARQPEALMAALENAVARRTPPAGSRPSDMRAAFELVSAGAPSGKSLIPWLGAHLALSERTLRRRFDAAFGYGPKTLDRILRFQRFLALARRTDRSSAADIAAETGYADQAHLVRESRRLAGSTPREIFNLFA
jgi:AraC-like DNA-binding protein